MVTRAIGLKFEVKYDTIGQVINVLLGVLVLSFLNATLGRIIKFLTLPISCLTLGIFSLVINAAIFYFVSEMNFGFTVGDFGAAFVGSICMSIISSLLFTLLPDKDSDEDD